jgi:putative restriction endonuclease
MKKDLPYYIHGFTHLKRDMKNGGTPRKPILLLSAIRLFEQGIYTDNRISVLPELLASFKSNWAKLVLTNHFPIFALPFYHLSSEPFWKLIANASCEKRIESKSSMCSFGNLTTAVKYALIDKELSDLENIAVHGKKFGF